MKQKSGQSPLQHPLHHGALGEVHGLALQNVEQSLGRFQDLHVRALRIDGLGDGDDMAFGLPKLHGVKKCGHKSGMKYDEILGFQPDLLISLVILRGRYS